jgi:hypothetical protein
VASYDRGDMVELKGTFTNDAGTLTNPTAVTCRVKNPNGVITVYVYGVDGALTRPSTGVYTLALTPDIAGAWTYRFEGTGAVQQAGEKSFVIKPSLILT